VVDVSVSEKYAAAYGLGAATSRVMCIRNRKSLHSHTFRKPLRKFDEYFRHYLLFENCKTFFSILTYMEFLPNAVF